MNAPPHLWQTARPPLSRNNSLCLTPVLKVVKALLKEVEVVKVVQAYAPLHGPVYGGVEVEGLATCCLSLARAGYTLGYFGASRLRACPHLR